MAASTKHFFPIFGKQQFFPKLSNFINCSPLNEIIFRTRNGCTCLQSVSSQQFSTASNLRSEKKYSEKPGFKIQKVITADGDVEVKKKKIFQPRITLIGTDKNLQVLPLEEANKIAKRRNLKLQQISERDPKTDRPVYQLVNVSELIDANKKKPESKTASSKDDKLLTINAKISEHDLSSKINHILKWLKKGQAVRVTISGEAVPAEHVFGIIAEKTKNDGRIPQKVNKGGEIRFQILLPKKVKTDSPPPTKTKENSDNGNDQSTSPPLVYEKD